MLRNLLKILAVGLVVGGVAMQLRLRLVEPDAIGRLCTGTEAPSWCLLRQGLVLGFVNNAYGTLSVVAVVTAMITRRRALAWLGLASGIIGCILYRFDPAGAGVLLSALALGRLGVSGDPQHRAGEQGA